MHPPGFESRRVRDAETHVDIIAILGATLIDGNGGSPSSDAVILIQGTRILAIGGREMPVPSQARIIDASGKYVIPGLMDANVHLFFACSPDALVRYEGRYGDVIREAAQIALKNGLTTVFDTWGPRRALTRIRDQISRGDIPGSRIFLAGNIIGLGGPTSEDFFPLARTVLSRSVADTIDARWEQGVGSDLLWRTPEEVRARVRAYIQSGQQDFVKYAGSGHGHVQYICFSEQVQRAIVEEGHRAGLTVQSHTTTPESLRLAIEAGVDLLQHPDLTGPASMPERTLASLVERDIPCAALLVTRRFLAWSDDHLPEAVRTFNRYKDENDARLINAGARILLTTDSGVLPDEAVGHPLLGSFVAAEDSPLWLGRSHFLWLEAAEQLGMDPMDALLAATRNIARAYRVDEHLGTLEEGKSADLLILERNPLEAAANYRGIHLVMKEGRVIDRDGLPTQPILTSLASSGPPPEDPG